MKWERCETVTYGVDATLVPSDGTNVASTPFRFRFRLRSPLRFRCPRARVTVTALSAPDGRLTERAAAAPTPLGRAVLDTNAGPCLDPGPRPTRPPMPQSAGGRLRCPAIMGGAALTAADRTTPPWAVRSVPGT